jgi:hypothetical protein
MRTFARRASAVTLALWMTAGHPVPAHAQGTARSLDIDLSPVSSAMGGASTAVFWGDDLSHWGNPALLGYQRGIRYEWQRSSLVPGLAQGVYLTSEAVKLGAGGVGIVLSGKPWGIGNRKLHYGWSEGVDEQGNPTGFFSDSYEKADSWGFGVSALQLAQSVLGIAGSQPATLSRYGDVSFGMNFKDVVIALAPGYVGGTASASTRDVGVLVRLTPIDFLDRAGPAPVRVDLALGWATLNSNDAMFVFLNEDQASPATRHRRKGLALRVAANPPGWALGPARTSSARWILRKGLSPLLSIGAAADGAKLSAGGGEPSFETSGYGVEVTVANVLSYRTGHYRDKEGDISGSTGGWGVALPIGSLAGVRFDQARFPQARSSDLPDVIRHAFSAWVDPLAFWRAMTSPAEQ